MKNTRTSRRSLVASTKSVRILSLKFAKRPRNHVLIYATVQSVSRPDKLNHNVTKVGRRYHCTCERSALGGEICRHIRRVRARVVAIRKAA